jgi:hypothetical protein
MSKVGLLDERPSLLVPIGHDKTQVVGRKKQKMKRGTKKITQLGKGKNSRKNTGRTK